MNVFSELIKVIIELDGAFFDAHDFDAAVVGELDVGLVLANH